MTKNTTIEKTLLENRFQELHSASIVGDFETFITFIATNDLTSEQRE